jgi:hypothetical protein
MSVLVTCPRSRTTLAPKFTAGLRGLQNVVAIGDGKTAHGLLPREREPAIGPGNQGCNPFHWKG